jgi:hypothetical protein
MAGGLGIIFFVLFFLPTIFGLISFFGVKRKPKFGIFLCAIGLFLLFTHFINMTATSSGDLLAMKRNKVLGDFALYIFVLPGILNIALGIALFRRQA